MFTGIITSVADVKTQAKTAAGLKLTIAKPAAWKDLQLGESVATEGVCLTVAKIGGDSYECELVPETLRKTAFGIKVPAKVNLERALAAGDRFSGHFVQGHVDGVGTVKKISKKTGYELEISFDPTHQNLVIPKGSITVNGVSLTVADVGDSSFRVALVPHTLKQTTLGAAKTGDKVNLEFDMIGKYIVNKRGDHAAR